MIFYAVKCGRNIGIYNTWEECRVQVNGYSGAIYKKFKTLSGAEEFINIKLIQSNQRTLVNKKVVPTKKESSNLQKTINDVINIYTDGSLVRKNNKIGSGYGIYIPKLNIEESHILN